MFSRAAKRPLSHLTNLVDGVGTNRYPYTSGGFLATEGGVFANDVVAQSQLLLTPRHP